MAAAMAVALSLHVLATVLWVGGMFFAFVVLRPAAAEVLDGPVRVRLWMKVLGRFFAWVWIAVAVILTSGFWITLAFFGGFGSVGLPVHLMAGVGLLMIALFLYVYFAPYRRMRVAVNAEDWLAASRQLSRIRALVATNLTLGVVVVVLGAGGRYVIV